jgi:hypothetical protein
MAYAFPHSQRRADGAPADRAVANDILLITSRPRGGASYLFQRDRLAGTRTK